MVLLFFALSERHKKRHPEWVASLKDLSESSYLMRFFLVLRRLACKV